LTFCTFERRPCFSAALVVERVAGEILRTAAERAFQVLLYCFMPDHVHLLVAGGSSDADLPSFARVSRGRASMVFRRLRGGTLWQRGYFEHVVRDDERLDVIARYIANNPVRASMVRTSGEWPFTGGTLFRERRL
jgi:putative transposase